MSTIYSNVKLFCDWFVDHFFGSYKKYKRTRENEERMLRTRGEVLKDVDTSKLKVQYKCNHKKGGMILTRDRVNSDFHEQGDDSQYAVVKHTFANGDMWVSCLRCGKKWKPNDPDYEKAKAFLTRNVPSKAVQFMGTGFQERHRQLVEGS